MLALLAVFASFMWGIFTAEMGHPVFRSLPDALLTIIPTALMWPALFTFSRMFSGAL
jgi:hypothetical protein